MKTTIKRILVFLTAALLVLSFAGCDKSGSIKKAFEKEGYTVETVNTDNDAAKTALKLFFSDEQIEKISEYEIILCTNGILNIAVIVKFPASGDLKDFLGDDYAKANEDGRVNGNCLLFTTSSEAKEIFK